MIRNITLSADEKLIAAARKKAQKEHRSFNEAFREWLTTYTNKKDVAENYLKLIKKLKKRARAGKKFTRDEMNER